MACTTLKMPQALRFTLSLWLLVSVYLLVILLVQCRSCSNRCRHYLGTEPDLHGHWMPLIPGGRRGPRALQPSRHQALIPQETRKHKSSRQPLSVKRCSRQPRPPPSMRHFLRCIWLLYFLACLGLKYVGSSFSLESGHRSRLCKLDICLLTNFVLCLLFNSFLTVANYFFFLSLCLKYLPIYLPSCFPFLSKHPSDLFVKWYSIYCCFQHISTSQLHLISVPILILILFWKGSFTSIFCLNGLRCKSPLHFCLSVSSLVNSTQSQLRVCSSPH